MTNKKNLLLLLLMLCIGFSPLQMLNAGNSDHLERMTHCANGDMDAGADPHLCDSAQCPMPAGSCGAHSITSISQQSPWTSMARTGPGGYFSLDFPRYQSHLDLPIYRPPIA